MAQQLELPLRLLHKVVMLSVVAFGRSSWRCPASAGRKGQHRALLRPQAFCSRVGVLKYSSSAVVVRCLHASARRLSIVPLLRPLRSVHFTRVLRRKAIHQQ